MPYNKSIRSYGTSSSGSERGSTSGQKTPDQLSGYNSILWDMTEYSAVKVKWEPFCFLPASWIRLLKFHVKCAVLTDVRWISGLWRRVVSLIGTNVSERPIAYSEYGGGINQTTQQLLKRQCVWLVLRMSCVRTSTPRSAITINVSRGFLHSHQENSEALLQSRPRPCPATSFTVRLISFLFDTMYPELLRASLRVTSQNTVGLINSVYNIFVSVMSINIIYRYKYFIDVVKVDVTLCNL
jgi:hypothetical protein